MFLFAVSDNLQSPSDDGSCEALQTIEPCLTCKSPLIPRKVSAGELSSPTTAARRDPMTFILSMMQG